MSLAAGTRLGPYEILAAIGAGGMGEVYRARDTRLDRDVAIKVLPEALAGDPDRLRRFADEARAIAALNHPNICQIHDIGPGYLVLEYVDGASLRGPMPVENALRLARQIAGALEVAHGRGILHRDLKPANIMVTREGTAKLLDFGLAKLMASAEGGIDEVTRTGEGRVLGTAAYMSPEQAEGKPLDARSDVFSFGAVLYELLSGTRAFSGNTAAVVLSAVLRNEPRPLAIDPALDRIIRRCLAKQPVQRFQTMQELRAALEGGSSGAGERPSSIAVLAFENMSGDKENEYFSDGLAEEIINTLARIPCLKVIARTSAFAFKGKNEDVRRIAEALGVTHVLEGSVRKSGSRIRVTTQLITAADGTPAWSERYDRELADVFAVQDEIATAITGALHVTLSPGAAPARRHRPNLPAYESYLRGLFNTRRRTPESMTRARKHFERAIELDPEFALAHAALGHLFQQLGSYGHLPPSEALPLMQQAGRRALAIDPSLPEGHAVLGAAAAMFDYDWANAERHFRLAMAHGVVPPLVHSNYALYCLLPMGRAQDAVQHLTLALNDDPLDLNLRGERAVCLRAAGRLAEGNDELRQLLELDATFPFGIFVLGVNLALDGEEVEALRLSETAYRVAPWFKPIVGFRAAMLKRAGDANGASALAHQLMPREGYSDPIGPAIFHLLCGEMDATADWVVKAIEQRQSAVQFFINAHATALRSSPRWPAIARMMKLPES
jgi:eukaryotic-like serine/threonine-protein kinase